MLGVKFKRSFIVCLNLVAPFFNPKMSYLHFKVTPKQLSESRQNIQQYRPRKSRLMFYINEYWGICCLCL